MQTVMLWCRFAIRGCTILLLVTSLCFDASQEHVIRSAHFEVVIDSFTMKVGAVEDIQTCYLQILCKYGTASCIPIM